MWPDWVSNPGPLTYESGALPTVNMLTPIGKGGKYENGRVASPDRVSIHLVLMIRAISIFVSFIFVHCIYIFVSNHTVLHLVSTQRA